MVEPVKPIGMKIALNESINIDVDAERLSDANMTIQSGSERFFFNPVSLSHFLRFSIPGEPEPITFKRPIRKHRSCCLSAASRTM